MTEAGDQLPDSSVNTGFGKSVSVIMGSNFADNRGKQRHGLCDFRHTRPGTSVQYDHSACTLNRPAQGVACGGSIISKGGYFSAYGNTGTSLFVNSVDQKTGAFRPFAAATNTTTVR